MPMTPKQLSAFRPPLASGASAAVVTVGAADTPLATGARCATPELLLPNTCARKELPMTTLLILMSLRYCLLPLEVEHSEVKPLTLLLVAGKDTLDMLD